jgi:myo-inositol 2-dehydrogenase/D-chiro-inositol 1-dehydrogenase
LTGAEAAEMADAAASAHVGLFPAHVVRYFPAYAALRAAVDQGVLGELGVLRFSRSGAHPTAAWFADEALSGGVVTDQMIHDLDQARWIAGEVATVSAVATRAAGADQPMAAAHVTLRHTSGAITLASGVWGPPHLTFTTEFSVTGTHGNLAHSSREEDHYLTDLRNPEAASGFLPAVDPADDPYYLELRDFVDAALGGAAPRVSAQDGVAAVELAEAAARSIATGQPVTLKAAVPNPDSPNPAALKAAAATTGAGVDA